MTTTRVLLLSLRPRFAEAILDGSKTIEVRRRPVNAPSGSRVILYASTPVMAIVGTARLQQVQITDSRIAWEQHKTRLGLDRDEFDAYLEGATPHLLHLGDVCRLDSPLPLRELQRGGFHPPQSFRYVAESDPDQLRALAEA